MNERIRELIREAESTTNEGIGFEGQEYLDMLMEQFAQLIVRECAQVAFEGDLKRAIGQWGADSDILKHFGVEYDVVKKFRS
jgi:hypothetical protein